MKAQTATLLNSFIQDQEAMSLDHERHIERLIAFAKMQDRDCAIKLVDLLTEAVIRTTGKGLELLEADLSGLDLSRFNLRLANLNRAALYSANFSGTNLKGASLICAGTERANFSHAMLNGAYVHSFAAQVCDFTNCDMSDLVDATGGLFHGCKLVGARFNNAVLIGCSFYQCDLTRTQFLRTKLQGVLINESLLKDADFSQSFVSELVITKCSVEQVTFAGARGDNVTIQRLTSCVDLDCANTSFNSCRLVGFNARNFDGQHMSASGAQLKDLQIENANLTGADFSNALFLNVVMQNLVAPGISLVAAAIRKSNFSRANLTSAFAENLSVVEANFCSADMTNFAGRCAVFRDCTLEGVNLTNAYLYRAMITGDPPNGSILRDADLTGAIFVQAYVASNLENAQAAGANFVYARLNQTSFKNADLSGVNFYKAGLIKTDFSHAKLPSITPPFFADRCVGLETSVAHTTVGELKESTLDFLDKFQQILSGQGRGST